MFNQADLTMLLKGAERAHKASGHSAAHWAEWYAQYMLPTLTEIVESDREVANGKAWD